MSRNYIILIVIFIAVFVFLLIRSNTKSTNGESAPRSIENTPLATQSLQTWKEFVWKEGNFRIMLPTKPHHVTDKVRDDKSNEVRIYDTFVSADPLGQGYMISMITFLKPISSENVEELLNSVVRDTINRTKDNKLNKMKTSTLKGYKAIDFSYDNNNRVIHGKVFAINNTVYLLGVIDNNPDPDTKEIDYFMNSFDTLSEK